jgi:hypothetical protein
MSFSPLMRFVSATLMCFRSPPAQQAAGVRRSAGNKRRYRLRGIVCYYLKHYVACFVGDKVCASLQWLSLDLSTFLLFLGEGKKKT